jgi:hypothetical protein
MRFAFIYSLLLCLLAPAGVCAQTTIELLEFGVGNAFRPGSSVGVRLRITSDLDEATPAMVQWEIENGDGDIAEFTRAVPVQARGGTTTVWLYGVLPPINDPTALLDTDWGFRLFQTNDGEKVKELASTRLSPRSAANAPQPVSLIQDQFLVIGPNPAGLRGYGAIPSFQGNPALNAPSHISWGVRVANLPDSWEGLAPFSTIVWSHASDVAFSPNELDGRRDVERALRAWIQRGGHLVILLPGSGDPWRLGRDDAALGDLFKGLTAVRHPAVSLATLLPVLSPDDDLHNPNKTLAIHTFDAADLPSPWRPLAAIKPSVPEHAKTLVWGVRRSLGFGAIDVLGIDVSDPDLQVQQTPRLPQTGVFWRPILGRRATAPSGSVINALADEKRLVTTGIAMNNLGTGALISTQIGLGGAAAQGLLAAMGLFAVYWIVAGPGGFAVLKTIKMQRHAWLVFVGTASGFAVLAWAGSKLLREQDMGIRHVTVLTHLYNPLNTTSSDVQFDAAETWFSAPLSGYGMVEVGLGDESSAEGNILNHFSPPPNGSANRFPDADRYEIPFESRAKYDVPARATSAEFAGQFLGIPAPTGDVWSATIRVDKENPLVLERDGTTKTIRLQGTLKNASGVTFDRVHLIQIHPLRTPAPRALDRDPGLPLVTDELPNYGVFVDYGQPWKPGASLDLGATLYPNGPLPERTRGKDSLSAAIKRSYVDPYTGAPGWGGVTTLTSMNRDDQLRYLAMLGLYDALPPPTWHTPKETQQPDSVRFHRMLAYSIDRSRWLGEACLIVVAFAENVPCPLPLTIDGETPKSDGRVMVQWIHPLQSATIEEDVEAISAGAFWPPRVQPEDG